MKTIYTFDSNNILSGGFVQLDSYVLKGNETLIAPLGNECVWNGKGWELPKDDANVNQKNIGDEIVALQQAVGKLMLNSVKKGAN